MRQAKSAQGQLGEYVEKSKAGPTNTDTSNHADELCIISILFGLSTPNSRRGSRGKGRFVWRRATKTSAGNVHPIIDQQEGQEEAWDCPNTN
jgi:hypothetical protein